MKEFLMLIRENQSYDSLSPEEIQADIEKHIQWVEQLVQSGHFKEGNPLDVNGKMIRGKDKWITDGPFVESKECVSGYYFLLAHDLDQATSIARGCPALDQGASLEIREVIVIDEA
jgi:hypothetical protein